MTTQQHNAPFQTQEYGHRFTYSVADNGGGVGTHSLSAPDGPLPKGALLTGAAVNVTVEGVQAGGGTARLDLQTAGDLQAAAIATGYKVGSAKVVATGTVAAIGLVDKVLLAQAINLLPGGILLTAERTPALVVAGQAVTALTFSLILFYVFP